MRYAQNKTNPTLKNDRVTERVAAGYTSGTSTFSSLFPQLLISYYLQTVMTALSVLVIVF